MTAAPKVGVLGAGSIGAYLGGRLVCAGIDTTFVGRPALADAVSRAGLRLTDYHGFDQTLPPGGIRIETDVETLRACDFVLVTVKGLDTESAASQLRPILRPGATVVSFQNGVTNPEVLRATLGDDAVLAGIVPFNVARRSPAHFHQGTSGRLAIEARSDGRQTALVGALRGAGLPVVEHAEMEGVQWGKLLVNLNNPINALSGLPLKQQLAQRDFRRLMAACVREGLAVLRKAGIQPRLDVAIPPTWVPALLELPDWLFRVLARPMVAIDPNARSSMWEDLDRGRRTEVDQLNGEIVRMGARLAVPTPINQRIMELVRQAESRGGAPNLTATELTQQVLS